MGKYILFEKEIEFSDAAERFLDHQEECWVAQDKAEEELRAWYQFCGDIKTVLKGYEDIALELLAKHAGAPLYNKIAQLGFYDISQKAYNEECLDFSGISDAFNQIAEKYNAILSEEEAAIEYRAERKASRTMVSGGGFGVGGAVKGMATAGAMNMASGAAHSIVNAIGNAGSAISSASSKRSLYNNESTISVFCDGLRKAVLASFNLHMSYVNQLKNNYIKGGFDSDKARALFENAQKFPEREKELLVESFKLCPWSYKLLKYIFVNYREERKNIWTISQRVVVDLSGVIEEALQHEYTHEAKQSEEKAQEAKKHILSTMEAFDVIDSPTLNSLEQDCLTRLCDGYKTTGKDANIPIIEAIKTYDALDKNKAVIVHNNSIWELAKQYQVKFTPAEAEVILSNEYTNEAKCQEENAVLAKQRIKHIMNELSIDDSDTFNKLEEDCLKRICPDCSDADEEKCNQLLEAINAYDALEKNKAPFINAIQKRINKIWAAEDFAAFSKLYMETSVADLNLIEKNKEIVLATGRTDEKKIFVDAFSALNPENVTMAAKYMIAKEKGGLASVFVLGKGGVYKTLTCGGCVKHPDILNALEEIKQEKEAAKGKGIFSAFGRKKESPLKSAQSTESVKYCTECGASISINAKFCPECGQKQD